MICIAISQSEIMLWFYEVNMFFVVINKVN